MRSWDENCYLHFRRTSMPRLHPSPINISCSPSHKKTHLLPSWIVMCKTAGRLLQHRFKNLKIHHVLNLESWYVVRTYEGSTSLKWPRRLLRNLGNGGCSERRGWLEWCLLGLQTETVRRPRFSGLLSMEGLLCVVTLYGGTTRENM